MKRQNEKTIYTISTSKNILTWQKAHNVCLGDKIRFTHKGRVRLGYLTGYDMDCSPFRLIVRYVNRMGFQQLVSIAQDDLINSGSIDQTFGLQ